MEFIFLLIQWKAGLVGGPKVWVSLEYRDFRCRENGPP